MTYAFIDQYSSNMTSTNDVAPPASLPMQSMSHSLYCTLAEVTNAVVSVSKQKWVVAKTGWVLMCMH